MSVTRRVDVGYPEDRDRAEERLDELAGDASEAEATDEEDADEAVVDSEGSGLRANRSRFARYVVAATAIGAVYHSSAHGRSVGRLPASITDPLTPPRRVFACGREWMSVATSSGRSTCLR